MSTPLRIGIIGFNGVTALDLIGPLEAFAAANIANGKETEQYSSLSSELQPVHSYPNPEFHSRHTAPSPIKWRLIL